jgi:type IV secretory pathway VirB10-like protein
VDEGEVEMNLANAYFNLNDTSNALNRYQPLSVSEDSKINSQANQQMGVVANRQGKFEEALHYFKQAMKAEPNNEQARYNYEMVKKKLEEQKKKEQQDKDKQDKKDDQKKDQNKDQKDQQNKDQKDKQDQKDKKDQDKKDEQKKDQKEKQDQKDKEQKEKEQKEKEQQKKNQPDDKKNEKKDKQDPSLSEKLKDMKISEEKAKMILEAMKNQEVQYLQQNKRKATKPKDKGKPDW